MPRGKNAEFIIAGICNLMECNYNVSRHAIYIAAEVDSSLTMAENWSNIKDRVLALSDYIEIP